MTGKAFLLWRRAEAALMADTRLHVATTDLKRLLDYAFQTPQDPLRSADCVRQRCDLIDMKRRQAFFVRCCFK